MMHNQTKTLLDEVKKWWW